MECSKLVACVLSWEVVGQVSDCGFIQSCVHRSSQSLCFCVFVGRQDNAHGKFDGKMARVIVADFDLISVGMRFRF
jgi:hypothetical protein